MIRRAGLGEVADAGPALSGWDRQPESRTRRKMNVGAALCGRPVSRSGRRGCSPTQGAHTGAPLRSLRLSLEIKRQSTDQRPPRAGEAERLTVLFIGEVLHPGVGGEPG